MTKGGGIMDDIYRLFKELHIKQSDNDYRTPEEFGQKLMEMFEEHQDVSYSIATEENNSKKDTISAEMF